LPVWFATPDYGLSFALSFLGFDLSLARMFAHYFNLDFDKARQVAEEVVSSFVGEVEPRGWLQFYYLDSGNHTLYVNAPLFCTVVSIDFAKDKVTQHWIESWECKEGLATIMLEERLGEIARSLARALGVGVEEVERRLRGVLSELKSNPRNTIRRGFARLLFFPPRSEDELRLELLRYTMGSGFTDEKLYEAWKATVKSSHVRSITASDVFKAWLAGRGTGYKLPGRYRVYESGDRVMVVAPKNGEWEIEWYKDEGTRWDLEASASHLSYSTVEALEDIILEDLRRGLHPRTIASGIKLVDSLSLADAGYRTLARTVYEMERDGRVYTRVAEEKPWERLSIHVIHNPDGGDWGERYLFLVEHDSNTYLLNEYMVAKLLQPNKLRIYGKGTLAVTQDMYEKLLKEYDEEKLAEAVYKALDNPRVSAELPDDVRIQLLNYLAVRAIKSLV